MSCIELNIHDEQKYVSVWLTKAESTDPALRESLKSLYSEYKQKKYRVVVFVPVSIEPSPIYDHNYIVGLNSNNQPQSIRLSQTQKTSVLEDNIKITKETCELIGEHLEKIYEEEYNECSD